MKYDFTPTQAKVALRIAGLTQTDIAAEFLAQKKQLLAHPDQEKDHCRKYPVALTLKNPGEVNARRFYAFQNDR